MKKALIPVSLAALVSAVVLAAPGNKDPFVPAQADPEPEEQARQLLNQPANFPREVRVQVEFIEMPHELLTEFLYRSSPRSADAGVLRDAVQARVKKGDAAILETMICTARSGEKALVESIQEYIYPTTYEPGKVPNSLTVSLGTGTGPEGSTPALDAGKFIGPPTPASFETRNLGSTLEVEPTLGGDGRIIDLRFAPTLVWHTGDTYYMEHKDASGNVTKVQMPEIYSIRMNTALTCLDGQYNMQGIATPKAAEGEADPSRKIMIFVKCDVLTVR